MQPVSAHSEVAARWAWLDAAYRAFLDGLPDDLHPYFSRSEGTAHVVTCGQTQVGKTTLVLSLLGVRADALSEVTGILRSGRAAGSSATSTPTRYGWSADDSWRLQAAGGDFERVGESDLRARLQSARSLIEAGRTDNHATLGIALPARFREREVVLDSVVTDLPGLDAKSPAEAVAAERFLEMYASSADVVIAVLKSDDLGALHPATALGRLLAPYTLVSDRFRVVLTHAAQNYWTSGSSRSVGDMTTYYREQLFTHDYSRESPLARSLQQGLYLFDAGDNHTSDPRFSAVQQCVDSSLLALRVRVAAQAVTATRFVGAAKSLTIISDFFADAESRLHDEVDKHGARVQHRQADLQKAEAAVEQRERKLQAWVRRREVLAAAVLGRVELELTRPLTPDPSGHEARLALSQTRSAFLEHCHEAWMAWASQLPVDLRVPRWSALETDIGDLFDRRIDCCQRCSNSWWKSGFGRHCVDNTVSYGRGAIRDGNEALKRQATQVLDPAGEAAAEQELRARKRLKQAKRASYSQRRALDRAEQEHAAVGEHVLAHRDQRQHAEDRAADFRQTLVDEARHARARALTSLSGSSVPLQRLAHALSALRDQADYRSFLD